MGLWAIEPQNWKWPLILNFDRVNQNWVTEIELIKNWKWPLILNCDRIAQNWVSEIEFIKNFIRQIKK